MRRRGVLTIFMLLLGACSGEEPQDADRGDQATVSATSTPEAAPTTASPPADADLSTTEAPETTTASETTTSPEPTTEDTSEEAAPSPAPTTPEPAPAPPLVDPCSADAMSTDLLGYAGGIEVFVCEAGWTYAFTVGSSGDSEFIAQRVDGTWERVMGMGSPTCREELLEQGAPESVLVDVTPCDVMYPPENGAPPPAEPPAEDCTIQTTLYGPASVELLQVSCEEARIQWAAADTGNPGSWEVPVPTPAGWECFVAPYEPDNWALGACYGPAGQAFALSP